MKKCHCPYDVYIGSLFEMETKEAQTTLRQACPELRRRAQDERSGAMPLPPFVLSLSKHERGSSPQLI
jgi:hypothetical protein